MVVCLRNDKTICRCGWRRRCRHYCRRRLVPFVVEQCTMDSVYTVYIVHIHHTLIVSFAENHIVTTSSSATLYTYLARLMRYYKYLAINLMTFLTWSELHKIISVECEWIYYEKKNEKKNCKCSKRRKNVPSCDIWTARMRMTSKIYN